MSKVVERFLRYISVDTISDENSHTHPSTSHQFDLARMLADELREIGVSNVRLDEEHCYVYGIIPANTETDYNIGFISHMDTSPDVSGDASNARIIRNYNGEDIQLNESVILSPAEFQELNEHVGCDLIVTDGNSLLGADDKAGIAEIITMAERILSTPEIKHGNIAIGFTSDEEIGCGAEFFDVEGFGVSYAYTVDGGPVGEIEYENFNADAAKITIKGKGIHPGSAKGKLVNALRIGTEFDRMLPQEMRPEYTENYEGFFNLSYMAGNVENAELHYIIRDHDAHLFEQKKEILKEAVNYLNIKYDGAITLEIKEQYRNMKEVILSHMHLIDRAKDAFLKCGIDPVTIPVRGGTDGAILSYKGLPCPNLSTGGYNFHSRKEYITVQALEKMTDVLTELAKV